MANHRPNDNAQNLVKFGYNVHTLPHLFGMFTQHASMYQTCLVSPWVYRLSLGKYHPWLTQPLYIPQKQTKRGVIRSKNLYLHVGDWAASLGSEDTKQPSTLNFHIGNSLQKIIELTKSCNHWIVIPLKDVRYSMYNHNEVLHVSGATSNNNILIMQLTVFFALAIMAYINNSLHLTWKYARIFDQGHYLFREVNRCLRA